MTNYQRKQYYLVMKDVEKEYKQYYESNPDVYFPEKTHLIYRNWKEFISAYQKTSQLPVTLPEEAPTIVGETLKESTFFTDDHKDVELVMNARYCPPFWHDLNFIKIMYVLNGSFIINTAPDRSVELQRGNCIIVPPGLEQSVFSFHDLDCVVNIFLRVRTFEKNFSNLLLEGGTFANFFWNVLYGKDESSIILINTDMDDRMDEMVLDLLEAHRHPEQYGNFYLTSYVSAFLSYILCVHKNTIGSIYETEINYSALPEIIRYIRQNYSTVTLAMLSEHFHKSEEYLCRFIKQETGYSLVQLLKKYRLHQAAIMLRETTVSVEEIMYHVGYTDISYFYKIFKERYHMTPLQYRNQERILNL